MILLLNGGPAKPPSRAATLAKHTLIALSLWNTEAVGLQLSRVNLFGSTLIYPTVNRCGFVAKETKSQGAIS